MKPRIIIVHGIHTNDDAGWMDYLVNAFHQRGWCALSFTYGYAYAIVSRFENPARAKRLAELVRPGDVVLGHSNGATLAYLASHLGAPILGAILLNPALDTGCVIGSQVEWVNLYANAGDRALSLSRIFLNHAWGPQGRDGLSVQDDRYRIVFTDRDRSPRVWGHSDILSAEKLPIWSQHICDDAEARFERRSAKRTRRSKAA